MQASPQLQKPAAAEENGQRSFSDDSYVDTEMWTRQQSTLGMFTITTCMPGKLGIAAEVLSAVMICLGTIFAVFQTTTAVQQWETTRGGAAVLHTLDTMLSIFFVLEFLVRVSLQEKRLRYVFSFTGALDGLVALVCGIGLFSPKGGCALMLQSVRLVRICRLLKLISYVEEARNIRTAIYMESRCLCVYLFFVAMILLILGTVLYLAEQGAEGFQSIPSCVWWAVVTLTTVGYGDAVPSTVLGKFCATCAMMLGYGLLAVPTIIGSLHQQRPAAKAIQLETTSHAGMEGAPPSSECGRSSFDFFADMAVGPCDNDQYGLVSSSALHSFAAAAVCAFLARRADLDFLVESTPAALVTESSCRSLSPLRFPELLEVGVAAKFASNSHSAYRVAVFRKGHGQPCAEGLLVHSWVHRSSWAPAEVPNAVRALCPVPPAMRALSARTPSIGCSSSQETNPVAESV